MNMRKIVDEYADSSGEELLVADGFDDAIIGVCKIPGNSFVTYDYNKVIEILMQDMPYEDAIEYFEFNIEGAYVGKSTPKFIRSPYD